MTTNGKLRWYNQKGLRKKNTNLQKGGTNFKENMYTAQQFAMSEPLSETQGLDNKSNKKPNKQGKSKKDKDKYTLRACSIQKRIDVETKVGFFVFTEFLRNGNAFDSFEFQDVENVSNSNADCEQSIEAMDMKLTLA